MNAVFVVALSLLVLVAITAVLMVIVWRWFTGDAMWFMKKRGLSYSRKDTLSVTILYREIFVKGEYDKVLTSLPPHSTILDIGANIGLFAVRCHDICVSPTVYAFEPILELHGHLSHNLALVAGSGRDHAFAMGISDATRTVDINYYPTLTAISSSSDDMEEKFKVGVDHQVKQVTRNPFLSRTLKWVLGMSTMNMLTPRKESIQVVNLSNAMRNIPGIIHLLKIDCEGCELEALEGISADDLARIERVFVEIENYRPQRRAAMEEILTANGFSVQVDDEDKDWCNMLALNKRPH